MPLNERGHEVPDPTPHSRTLQFTPSPSLHDLIKTLVRHELSQQAAAEGHETFEEADDFDVGDDYDPRSPHELDEWQEVEPVPSKQPKAAAGPAAPSGKPATGGGGGEAPATPPGATPEGGKP